MSPDPSLPVVIVAEDDSNDLLLLQHTFAGLGVTLAVATFGNGADVIDFFHRVCVEESPVRPRLLLLDLHIPQIDGCGVIAWARRQKALAALRIVVVSGSGDSIDVKRAESLGANRVLRKPIEEGILLAELKRLGEPPRAEPTARPV